VGAEGAPGLEPVQPKGCSSMSKNIHAQAGRYGGLKSWANTVDRAQRTAPGRAKSPSSIEYHLAKLDPERFANASEAQRMQAAEAARRAHFQHLALRSAQVRRRGGDAA